MVDGSPSTALPVGARGWGCAVEEGGGGGKGWGGKGDEEGEGERVEFKEMEDWEVIS